MAQSIHPILEYLNECYVVCYWFGSFIEKAPKVSVQHAQATEMASRDVSSSIRFRCAHFPPKILNSYTTDASGGTWAELC